MAGRALVTGAFSNIGAAVADDLVGRGWLVETLTNRPAPEGSSLVAHPLWFDEEWLAERMRGFDVIVNTYWIRFPFRGVTFAHAVANSKTLVVAAAKAGAGRFVQVSVSNASPDSPLGYYRGKAAIEEALRASGLAYGIVRPTYVVGPKDVLTNNVAWFLRRLPVVVLPSGGGYEMQPVTLGDAARIIADAVEAEGNVEVDAAGPERLTFGEYVRVLAGVGRRPWLVQGPPWVMTAAMRVFNLVLRDVVLTREELEGLRGNMLISHEPALGRESALDWLKAHGSDFGRSYMNDTRYRFPPEVLRALSGGPA